MIFKDENTRFEEAIELRKRYLLLRQICFSGGPQVAELFHELVDAAFAWGQKKAEIPWHWVGDVERAALLDLCTAECLD